MPTRGRDMHAFETAAHVLAAADQILRSKSTGDCIEALIHAIARGFPSLRVDVWEYDGVEAGHLATAPLTPGAGARVPVDAVCKVLDLAREAARRSASMLVTDVGDDAGTSAEAVRQLTVHALGPDPRRYLSVLHETLDDHRLALLELLVHRVTSEVARLDARRRQARSSADRNPPVSEAGRVPEPTWAVSPPDAASEVTYVPPALAKRLVTPQGVDEFFSRLAAGLYEHLDVVRVAVYDRGCHRMSEAGDPSTNISRERGVVLDTRDGLLDVGEVLERDGSTWSAWPLIGAARPNAWIALEWDNLTGPPDERLCESIVDYAASVLDGIESYHLLEGAFDETILALQQALDAADQYTGDHARQVAEWAVEIAVRLGVSGTELRDVEVGALLHDIGKIAMPREILNKPGALTNAEFEVMKSHTVVGERIIAPVEHLEQVQRIVRHEHERWDGNGYPDGLSGDEIPLGSRIILVCDAYHAITSDRPYRQAQPHEVACQILEENAGSQFDPAVVAVFLEMIVDSETQERIERLCTNAPQFIDRDLRAKFVAWEQEVASGGAPAGPTQEERHAPQRPAVEDGGEAEAA